jgi:hypothetical protein
MALTAHSDVYAAVTEDGLNRVIRHVMRQRPSLFTYATTLFLQSPDLQLCAEIDLAPGFDPAEQPIFTQQSELPVAGTVEPFGLDYCLQITDVRIDLHPGNTLTLPPELGALPEQRFALHLQACFGLLCLGEVVIGNVLAEMEAAVATSIPPPPVTTTTGTIPPGTGQVGGTLPFARRPLPRAAAAGNEMLCTCLEVDAIGHFEWGTIGQDQQQWLKVRLDGLEIVDLQTVPPSALEETLECYLGLVLRLGILPQLITPMESLVLDITAMLLAEGITIDQRITLAPSAVPADVPNNPAIAHDQLEVFLELTVEAV